MSAREAPPAATRAERSEARLEGRARASASGAPAEPNPAVESVRSREEPPAATRAERSEARLEGRARASASGAPAEPNPAVESVRARRAAGRDAGRIRRM